MRHSQTRGGRPIALISCILLAQAGASAGEEAVYSKLPIREVTVFKDGPGYDLQRRPHSGPGIDDLYDHRR